MLTGRKPPAAASKQAYTEEALRIYKERLWLMSPDGMWIEQDGRPVHFKNLKLKKSKRRPGETLRLGRQRPGI
jgi:hypothetical protein